MVGGFVEHQTVDTLCHQQGQGGPGAFARRQVCGVTVDIARVQPALFSADATGLGQAAAIAIQIGPNNEQIPVELYRCTAAGCEPKPLQAREQNVLVLFGTGIRNRNALSDVKVTVGGIPVDVLYAGPQPTYAGLDQVNVLLPRDIPVTGIATVRLTVEERLANTVTVLLQ